MTFRQQIITALHATVQLCWLLAKNILLLIIRGLKYMYVHRVQIVQHKLTLPLLVVFSVAWTGYSAFNHIQPEPALSTAVSRESAVSYLPVHLVSHHTGNTLFTNTKLITHIMEWIGTPHRDNYRSKNGTDCSGFVQAVFEDTYGFKLSRNSKEMYKKDVERVRKHELKEGDLVFFNTSGKGVSHVGIYLKEGKFAHTSSSKGVTVSSLYEKYYQKNYYGAGRVKLLND